MQRNNIVNTRLLLNGKFFNVEITRIVGDSFDDHLEDKEAFYKDAEDWVLISILSKVDLCGLSLDTIAKDMIFMLRYIPKKDDKHSIFVSMKRRYYGCRLFDELYESFEIKKWLCLLNAESLIAEKKLKALEKHLLSLNEYEKSSGNAQLSTSELLEKSFEDDKKYQYIADFELFDEYEEWDYNVLILEYRKQTDTQQ